MSKNKLTKRQERLVKVTYQRRLQPYDRKNTPRDAFSYQQSQDGVVVSRLGMHADVENAAGQIYRCNLRRTLTSLVAGDKVVWRTNNQQLSGINGIIESVYPRSSVLTRPNLYNGIKPIAANMDQIVIVAALFPEFSLNIIDRYLVACETTMVEPLIVLNKIDLLGPAYRAVVEKQIAIYPRIGYRVLLVSSRTGEGIKPFQEALTGRTSIFAGQSGAGKSSLLNMLRLPDQEKILVNVISEHSGLGQHTTTTARLYHFHHGGYLIDSPGVREFGLWDLEPRQIASGFVEFRNYLGTCKFRDCRHNIEPGCRIRSLVKSGVIPQERFDNYHRILNNITQIKTRKSF
ncbi:small ribosomal subunit biogenesis GTPase RsgA [Candidatus Steffania adelgidicola]|uniref:small ribosomal subunit biogenesis GTPase RsgA n=1 Tax=Candidatus Steffania adelgidicola TaxID=1076626 RepID=UPI001D008F7B|nr:small ribosomal subunit biogenesis GTPase RsgA [Candidatus Steffania adelgidicola]UDG79681.1 Small ribosomal subunit biogenesis GTPase RsgA [Candidatus Steffania adelgidicola]